MRGMCCYILGCVWGCNRRHPKPEVQALPQIQLIMESELWQDSEGPGVGHQGISEKTVILEGK